MKTVYIDMDGVLVNWLDSAIQACGLTLDSELINGLEEGKSVKDYCPNVWDHINQYGPEWWANLEPLPWYNELIDTVDAVGLPYCVLSSPGSILRYPETAKNACQGKIDWMTKYLPEVDLVLAHSKYYCASSDKFLIDDNYGKLDKFNQYDGITFKWPLQYNIKNASYILDKLYEDLLEFKNDN